MKYIFFIFLFIIFYNSQSEYCYSTPKGKPEPEKEAVFTFPEFKEINFDNGFRMYLVPDNRQPSIAFRFLIKINPEEGTNSRILAKLVADLLNIRSDSKSNEETSRILGKTGAIIKIDVNSEFITVNCLSLSKNSEEIIKYLFSMISKSEFNQKDIASAIQKLSVSGAISNTQPEYLAEALAGRILRGTRETGAMETEALKSIKPADIENFYKKQFTPQNVTLSIVGEFKDSILKVNIMSAMKNWKDGKEYKPVKISNEPLQLGIYFIPRTESVQSYIMYACKGVNASAPDFEKLNILTDIAGSRIYRELRENRNIAYSSRGYITSYSTDNYIAFSTAVANENTLTAINSIKNLLRDMITTEISAAEVKTSSDYAVNRHYMSFDKKEYIANFIQDAIFYGISKETIKNYAELLSSIKPYDINQLAKKYLNPDNMYIIVVGDPALKQELSRIGNVYEYSAELYSTEGPDSKLDKVSLSAQELIEKYTDAIGGKSRLGYVNSMIDSSSITMSIGSSVFNGFYNIYRKSPDMFSSVLECGSLNLKMYSDGNRVWMKSNSYTDLMGPEESTKLYLTTKMFAQTRLIEMGYTCKVLGKTSGMIMMEVISKYGNKSIYYFDTNDYLLRKIETVETEPQLMRIVEIYDNYKEFDGIILPTVIETQTPIYNMKAEHTYYINYPLDGSVYFTPNQD
jgi:zinc protease